MALSFRQSEILDIAKTQGRVVVEDLAQRFDVTLQTIRRDLTELADSILGYGCHDLLVENVATESRRILGPDWSLLTWGDQYQAFFALINQQRVMMYFTLSIIMIVAMHAPMLSPPEMTLINSASFSEKPTACHSTAP